MNGEQFYTYFKEGLEDLGVKWGEKDKVTVTFTGEGFRMTVDGRKTVEIKGGSADGR